MVKNIQKNRPHKLLENKVIRKIIIGLIQIIKMIKMMNVLLHKKRHIFNQIDSIKFT